MFRVVIPAILAAALTACGGGGAVPNTTNYTVNQNETVMLSHDSSSLLAVTLPTPSTPAPAPRLLLSTIGSITYPNSFIPSLAGGDFKGDGSKYVVVSGWLVSQAIVPPVKIYKLNSDGTGSDATVDVLGSNFSISVNYPLVADFNRDGIDDIFFPGYTDTPASMENPSAVFLSRPGLPHQRVDLDGLVTNHGSAVIDLNRDGWPDVIGSGGDMWINNRNNGFTFVQRTIGASFAASGACVGDFDGSGDTQLVVTDFTDGSGNLTDNVIFKIRPDLTHYAVASLPTPLFDRNRPNGSVPYSHDVSCVATDLNNDGRQDIVVISYSNDLSLVRASGPQSTVQVYYNKGNFVFSDPVAPNLSGYTQGVLATYTPKIIDFNNDGRLDIWLMNASPNAPASQIWLNNGNETFTQKNQSEIQSLLTEYRILSNGISTSFGTMLPAKFNNKWNFVVTSFSNSGSLTTTLNIGYATTQWSF